MAAEHILQSLSGRGEVEGHQMGVEDVEDIVQEEVAVGVQQDVMGVVAVHNLVPVY